MYSSLVNFLSLRSGIWETSVFLLFAAIRPGIVPCPPQRLFLPGTNLTGLCIDISSMDEKRSLSVQGEVEQFETVPSWLALLEEESTEDWIHHCFV